MHTCLPPHPMHACLPPHPSSVPFLCPPGIDCTALRFASAVVTALPIDTKPALLLRSGWRLGLQRRRPVQSTPAAVLVTAVPEVAAELGSGRGLWYSWLWLESIVAVSWPTSTLLSPLRACMPPSTCMPPNTHRSTWHWYTCRMLTGTICTRSGAVPDSRLQAQRPCGLASNR